MQSRLWHIQGAAGGLSRVVCARVSKWFVMVGFEKVSAYSLVFLCSHGPLLVLYLCKQEPKYLPQALLKERDRFKNGVRLFYLLCLK